MTRPCRASALLDLLHASGIEADGAYDARKGVGDIPPGMLYSSRGLVYHIPFRAGRGYIGALVPDTAESKAYIGLSTVVELPVVAFADPRYRVIYRARRALEKK